jgi:aryl-alcohol dehydrogenase-like predicted oxidoreductase
MSRSGARCGVNFFDNAEVMRAGNPRRSWARRSSRSAGASVTSCRRSSSGASRKRRISTTLNRKYLLNAIDGSLRRLQLDYVDLVYCHRPDPNTPIEETVWAMSDMIVRGKAL